jgi:glycine dehydrogenase subunit 2
MSGTAEHVASDTPVVSAGLPVAAKPRPRRFQQASWDEPIIFERSVRGARGVLPPLAEPGVTALVGDPAAELPAGIGRAAPPALPELSQLHVVRHYTRLSQETLGVDLNVDVGQGTCTMKYSPKVDDRLAADPRVADTHPLQDPSTVQGTLEIMWRLERMLAEISGMDRVSLQPASGSAAIWANVAMIRAYHETRGEGFGTAAPRDEVVTTIFSHPSNAAAAKVAGYRVITLYPDADGYPDLEALKAAVSERTAALLITNPEDTGIFNPRIEEFVRAVHAVGGLCSYDQANANGILGITRARDAGFDVCHFNIHKTFSTPHACGGPGAGAVGVSADLAPFLPRPTIERDADGRLFLDDDRPLSIGKVRPWYGVTPNLVRAYAWVMSLGAEGLRAVAETAVLNNNYLLKKVLEIRGASAPYASGKRRIEQVRYSWEELGRETGIHSEDIGVRAADFGTHYWTSHHPYVVPEPMTLEPTESYSREDLDEYAAILAEIAREAYEDPEMVRTAPHRSTIHRIDHESLDDPARWAVTWRAYRRKHLGGT